MTTAQALSHYADHADLARHSERPEELHSIRTLVREGELQGQSDPELQALVLAAVTIQVAGADLSPETMLRESRELMAALRASGKLSHDEVIQAVVDAAFQRLTEAPTRPLSLRTAQTSQTAAFSVRT